MEFKERSDKKILDDIKSAGQTFLGYSKFFRVFTF